MGTRCDVVLIHPETDFSERVFVALRNEILQLEALLSRYLPESPVSQLNRLPVGEPFAPDDTLWDILQRCFDFYRLTDGVFDVTLGKLTALWKHRREGAAVTPAQIEEARNDSGFGKISWDAAARRLTKTAAVEFDFGAVGKGFALDQARFLLDKQQVKQAFISFGESSVLALGTHPAGNFWPVGIPNPLRPGEILHQFQVRDQFITSSGTVLNSDRQDGSVRSHLIDPHTGNAVAGRQLVAVKTRSAVWGEVLSTTWLVMDHSRRQLLASKLEDSELLEVVFSEEGVAEKKIINSKTE